MKSSKLEFGHVSPFWGDSHRHLSYTKQPITEEEVSKWEQSGYDYVKSFSGKMYDNRNPMPDWISTIENLFGMYNQTYTFYRMDTLEIMPTHSDHYNTYCRLFNISRDKVQRAILMLEDWKPGHYFELDGVGYVNWKAGDWFKWTGDVPHAASNIGIEPRYTLQVTGMSVVEGQLEKLVFSNVPGIINNCHQPFAREIVEKYITNDHAMIYFGNRHITDLEKIVHTDSEIATLNSNGLSIYLFEPLSSYDSMNPDHNMGFYSEFNNHIEHANLRAEELDSIYAYATTNNLCNITVHTCDYNVEKYYTHYTDVLKLKCDDLFLKSQKKIVGLDDTFRNQFNKKFVCLNWRFTKHRQLLATFLANESCCLSWHHRFTFDDLKNNLFFDMDSWNKNHSPHYKKLESNVDLINEHTPYIVDIDADAIDIVNGVVDIWPNAKNYSPGETPSLYNSHTNGLHSVYQNCFVDVVNETRFAQPTANFSEKVFQAMQYQKPFIVVAPPKTLEYIKSLGFRTFNDFWDESYDDELDHGERLAKIFDLITEISNMTIDESRALYEKMIPVVMHNLQQYKKFIGTQ